MTHFRLLAVSGAKWLPIESVRSASISLERDCATIALGRELLAIHEELSTLAAEATRVVGVVLHDDVLPSL